MALGDHRHGARLGRQGAFSEEAERMSEPVLLFRRPNDWDELTDVDQMAFALDIAERMGFKDAPDPTLSESSHDPAI